MEITGRSFVFDFEHLTQHVNTVNLCSDYPSLLDFCDLCVDDLFWAPKIGFVPGWLAPHESHQKCFRVFFAIEFLLFYMVQRCGSAGGRPKLNWAVSNVARRIGS